jgi:hypothetical protein
VSELGINARHTEIKETLRDFRDIQDNDLLTMMEGLSLGTPATIFRTKPFPSFSR